MIEVKSAIRAIAKKELSDELIKELEREDPLPLEAEKAIASAKTEAEKENKDAKGKEV